MGKEGLEARTPGSQKGGGWGAWTPGSEGGGAEGRGCQSEEEGLGLGFQGLREEGEAESSSETELSAYPGSVIN